MGIGNGMLFYGESEKNYMTTLKYPVHAIFSTRKKYFAKYPSRVTRQVKPSRSFPHVIIVAVTLFVFGFGLNLEVLSYTYRVKVLIAAVFQVVLFVVLEIRCSTNTPYKVGYLKMAGATMLVHVTHIDDSIQGRQGPCLGFWGMTHDRNLYLLMEKYVESIRPYLETSSPPLDLNVPNQVCCVLINHQWHRARVLEPKLSHAGTVEVFRIDSGDTHSVPLAFVRTLDFPGHEVEHIREWPPLASKYILADMVAPRGPSSRTQWSEPAMMFLKIHVENRTWKAAPMGMYGENQGVRLFDTNNQLLATLMIQQGLGLASQTYHDALHMRDVTEKPPAFMKAALSVGQMGGNGPISVNNRLPPSFAIPSAYRDQHPAFAMAAGYSPKQSPVPPRAFVTNDIPDKGRHDVIVTRIPDGPLKFYVQLKSEAKDLQSLRKKLDSLVPHPLQGKPQTGTPCIAVSSADKMFHRGLITAVRECGNQCSCNVYFADIGTQEPVSLTLICNIPDDLLLPRMFAYRVSLFGVEEVSKLTGLNEIFAALVKSASGLQIEVVEDDERNQKVNLYDADGRSFREVLVSIYSNFLTSKAQTNATSPSTVQPNTVVTTCVTAIAPVQLAVEENLRVIYAQEPGVFFGRFEKTPVNSLHEMATELKTAYSFNPNSALLYADVRSHLGHYGVFLWEEDCKFYRIRITKELVNDAEIHLIDYGNILVVPRCKILAPLESLNRFYHPPYGVRCKLEDEVTLSASEWTTSIMDKSIKVKIGECDNEIYSVTLTKDPCNEDIIKLVSKKVAPICDVINSTPAVGIRSNSPPTVAGQLTPPEEAPRPKDDRRKRNGDNGNFGRIHYQHPNAKDSNWRLAGTEEGSSVQTKPLNKETNWRTSANPVQEVIRAPRGPPPTTGNGETKGPVGFQRLGSSEQSQPSVVKPITELQPTVPAIPKPVTPVPVRKQPSYSMQVLPSASKPVEMVCIVDPSNFYVRLSEDSSLLTDMIGKLNAVYSDETKPCIQNAKAGSACVIQYIEDNQWYRGKILEANDSSLTIPQVPVLFVDYGNMQLCPPEQVKCIEEAFVQQPPLVFHCKLKGVEGTWTDEDLGKFDSCTTMLKTLSATFTACDADGKYPIRLIVDNEGVKTVINDLFGAKTTVPPPSCGYTYLPVSDTPVEMTIAWYHNPGRIFISPVDLSSYQSLLDELEEFYSSMPADELVEDQPEVGLPCVARFTEDQRYYRSRILTIQGGIAKVLFVDYGNEQDTQLSQLKRIVPGFMAFPQLTWHSKLRGVKKLTSGPLNPDPQKHIAACFSIGQTLSVVFHPVAQDNNGVFEVDLIIPGIGDVAQYLINQKILDSIPSEIHTELAAQSMNFTEGQIISTHAVVPHVNSATEFWVHFDPESVAAFMERIDALALDPKFINANDFNATVGKPCLAYFADDGRWYRAIVESIDGSSATVYYVDYGNSCIVNTSDLRALPVDVSQQPAFAYKCCVDGAEAFTDDVAVAFQTFILELAFSVQCVNVIEGTLKVRLYSTDGVDLMEQLCNVHLNQPTIEELPVENVVDVPLPTTETQCEVIAEEAVHDTCPVIEDGLQIVSVTPEALTSESDLNEQTDHVKVYVSYSISPNQFWLQLRQNDDKLLEMLDEITKVYDTDRESFLIQGQPVTDRIYGVYHPSYGDWYRGRIKGISENIAEVHFVDYGDTYNVLTGDMLELPQQFANIPAMAIEGSLSVDSSEAVAEKFNAVCLEPDQIHTALFETDENGVQFVKSLFIGDTNILDLITVEEPLVAHYDINLSTIPEALTEQSVQTPSADDTNMDAVHPEEVSFVNAVNVEAEVKTECDSSVELDEIPPFDLNFAPGQRISSCASTSYIESPADIWLQLDPTAVDNLMNEIAAVYPSTLAAAKPVLGNHCLALLPSDGQWHRAVITQTDMGSDQVRVTYVDYGSSSIVNVGDLRVLPVHFAEQPALALKCALDGIEGNDISPLSSEQCGSVLDEEVLTVVFSGSTSDRVYVRLFDVTGSDLNEKLGLAETFKIEIVGNTLLESTPFGDVEMASPLQKTVEPAVFNLISGPIEVTPEVVTQPEMAEDVTAGYSTICTAELVDGAATPTKILQNTAEYENETEVMDRLQSAPVDNTGECLTLVAAEELEHQEAKVICNMEETVEKEDDLAESCIQVAVGFAEDLEEPVVDVMQETAVEENLFDASPVLVAAEVTEVVDTTLQSSIEQNNVVASAIQVSTGYSEIEAVEIADDLQQEVTIENDFADSFSHSIDTFICQASLEQHVELKEDEVREQLTILEQEMACAEGGTQIDVPKHSSDQMITESINLEPNESLSADALVQCSITSTDLHPSEELPVIEGSTPFELETTEEVATSVPTCGPITSVDKAVVENVYDEQIVLRMKSEVVSEEEGDQVAKGNVYVSHVVSPGDFWIQKFEHVDVIGEVDKQLLDMNLDSHDLVEQFVVGNIYAAKHHYYGYWYRAKLLKVGGSVAEVIFIDYGDMQTVPTLDIRQLPPMLADVAPMALHCKLTALHLDCWPEKTTKVMKDSCHPEDVCTATFRDEVDGIVEVESLFLGDFDVVRAVLSSLVCDHAQQPRQEPISPQQGESHSETPQLDAHLFLIRVEPDTVKTSGNRVESEISLPID